MKTQTHNQVKIGRDTECDTRWIPSQFAKQGELIDVKQNGEWSRGWKVLEVFDFAIDSAYLQEHSQNYKNHRKATDV